MNIFANLNNYERHGTYDKIEELVSQTSTMVFIKAFLTIHLGVYKIKFQIRYSLVLKILF